MSITSRLAGAVLAGLMVVWLLALTAFVAAAWPPRLLTIGPTGVVFAAMVTGMVQTHRWGLLVRERQAGMVKLLKQAIEEIAALRDEVARLRGESWNEDTRPMPVLTAGTSAIQPAIGRAAPVDSTLAEVLDLEAWIDRRIGR